MVIIVLPIKGLIQKNIEWNKDTYIAVTRDIINKKLIWYINGVITNTETLKLIPVDGNNELLIGKGYVNEYKGTISNLLLFNKVLTPIEINKLSKTEGLVGKDYSKPKVSKKNGYVSLQGVIGSKSNNLKDL